MTFVWQDHHFIAGRLCLDFVNTLVYPDDPARREDRLRTAADLLGWRDAAAVRSGRFEGWPIAGGRAQLGGASDLRRARAIRATLERLFRTAAREGSIEPAAVARLAGFYRQQVAGLPLVAAADGLSLRGDGAGTPSDLLALVLQSAMELAFSPELKRVRDCPGCGWLTLDRSKNGRKKWCQMSVCGNRAKARRHYRRKRDDT